MEENGKIAFLDVLIIRNNNTLKKLYIARKHMMKFIYNGNISCHRLGKVAHYSQ